MCIWATFWQRGYFYSHCCDEQLSPVGTLCSSKLSHSAKGTASAARARSACVLSHLGKRPHTWAGVALSLSWMDWLGILWLLQERCGCWGWLVCSWPGHTGGSQLLQTSPAVSIYDSDGLFYSRLFKLLLCVFNFCIFLDKNKDFLDRSPRKKRGKKIIKPRTHLFLSETSQCVWGCIFFLGCLMQIVWDHSWM